MLAASTLIPTSGNAQGLVEYAVILILAYGVSGESIESVYQLDHAGAVGPDRPNCSFTGTAEIEFVEVASGNNMEPESTDIVVTEDFPIQFTKIAFPVSSSNATMAAVLRINGQLPANCTVIVNHFKTKFGQTTEVVPPSTLRPGHYVIREVAPNTPSSNRNEPSIAGATIVLGEGQVANLGLVARPKAVAPGLPPENCRLDGGVIVRRLDNGQEPVEIPFEGDPFAILHDVTDASTDPPPPGTIQTYTIIVVNNGPSLLNSRPPCDDLSLTVGIADRATGENAASSYVNVHSTRDLNGEPR